MKRFPRFLVVASLVLSATVVPAAAQANEVDEQCEMVQEELAKYGWHFPICPDIDPENPSP